MDKLMRDMEKLCNTTAAEREESYRKCKEAAEITERLLSDDWTLVVDGGTEIRTPLSVEWESQVLEDDEVEQILRHDIMFDVETQVLLEDIRDMEEFFQETVSVAHDMGHREASTSDVVELLIMLDKELAIYNNG